MGMYNEVFRRCPDCGQLGEAQVAQVVLGFGGFNLDDPDDLAERLDKHQLRELRRLVKGVAFQCAKGHRFVPYNSSISLRRKLAKKLFA